MSSAHHFGLVHNVQLAHLAEMLVQHLDEAVDELEHSKFILRAHACGASAGRVDWGEGGGAAAHPRARQRRAAWRRAILSVRSCESELRMENMLPRCKTKKPAPFVPWWWCVQDRTPSPTPHMGTSAPPLVPLTSSSSTPTMKKSEAYRR